MRLSSISPELDAGSRAVAEAVLEEACLRYCEAHDRAVEDVEPGTVIPTVDSLANLNDNLIDLADVADSLHAGNDRAVGWVTVARAGLSQLGRGGLSLFGDGPKAEQQQRAIYKEMVARRAAKQVLEAELL